MASAASKVHLSELTGTQAREAVARRPVILIPLGSYEDQGPHAPMGDHLLATRMSELIAARAQAEGVETYIAPTVPFGGADYFGTMPGAISLSQSTLRAVLTDIFECLIRHKLTRLVVMNGHAGNIQAIHDVTQAMMRAHDVMIPSFYLWRTAFALFPGIVGADVAKQSMGHGADPLTSICLHLSPELVQMDVLGAPLPPREVRGMKVTGFGLARFENTDVNIPNEIGELAPNGVMSGDPRLATAEKGEKVVAQLTEVGTRFVKYWAAQTA